MMLMVKSNKVEVIINLKNRIKVQNILQMLFRIHIIHKDTQLLLSHNHNIRRQ